MIRDECLSSISVCFKNIFFFNFFKLKAKYRKKGARPFSQKNVQLLLTLIMVFALCIIHIEEIITCFVGRLVVYIISVEFALTPIAF